MNHAVWRLLPNALTPLSLLLAPLIVLPAPTLPVGATLEAVLRQRRSTREVGPDPLPLATLSALLWAAFGISRSNREFLAGVASGCIAENVYLACAAFGLGTVLRGLVDRRALAHALGLPATQRITLAGKELCIDRVDA